MISSWESTPIVNIAWMDGEGPFTDAEHDKLHAMYMRMCMKCRPPVKTLKQLLGRQKTTWNGWVRHWVWEDENWRVFASKRGVFFEVRVGLTRDESWRAFEDFMRKIGLVS